MRPIVPEGAYYVLVDTSELGFESARAAAMCLLETAGVATIPGTAFFRGASGERFLRVCFAKEDDILAQACERVAGFRR